MAQCLSLLSVVAVSLTFSTVTSALECGPGYKVKGNQCEECKTGTFNSKRDGSTSCSDCLIRCPFNNGVITKSCTTTNDLHCDCQEGYEKETTGELTNCYRKKATECGPGYKVKGNQCEECKTGTFNSKRDRTISFRIRCPFQKGVITAKCTTTNDLQCDCQEGYEKKTFGEETICSAKTATVPQETTTSIPAISTTENPGKPKVPQETSTSMPTITTTKNPGNPKAQVHIPLILLSLMMSYIVLYYII